MKRLSRTSASLRRMVMQLKIIPASPLYLAYRARGFNEKPPNQLTFAGRSGLGAGRPASRAFAMKAYCSFSSPVAQRAFAAFWAMALRSSGVNFAALARPPFIPPSLPSATAAGFFLRGGNCNGFGGSDFNGAPIACSTTRRAF